MTHPSIEILEKDPRGRFMVTVAVLAVVTTLLAAAVGLLYAVASNAGDRASARAQEQSLYAARELGIANTRIERSLRLFELGSEQNARASRAFEQAQTGPATDRRAAARDAVRWSSLAAGTERMMKAGLGPLEMPANDARFPFRLRIDRQRAALVTLALRDAGNAEASAWGKRGAAYAAILTLLTVALYLFGFALTPQGRELGGLFVTVGVVFFGIGVIFGPVKALSGESSPSKLVAGQFADGVIAFENREYAKSRRLFDSVISRRPEFAAAYLDRSDAVSFQYSPRYVENTSLTTPEARAASINDLRMARALGLQSPVLLTNLGFELFAEGVQEHRHDALQEGTEITRTAIAGYASTERPTGPPPDGCRHFDVNREREAIAIFNLGAALLAAGHPAAARDEYARAICVSLAAGTAEELAPGALTDLELVARYGPIELRDDVGRIKELIVGSVAEGQLAKPPASDTRLRGLNIFIEAGYAEVKIAEATHVPHELFAVWFYRDTSGPRRAGLGWSVLPEISGPAYLHEDQNGELFNFESYIAKTRTRCLPNGRYRIELYDRGRLIGQTETEYGEGGGFVPFRDLQSASVGCRPSAWAPAASRAARGFQNRDGTQGMYVTRLNNVPADNDLAAPRLARRVMEKVIATVPHRFPALRYLGAEPENFMELGNYVHDFKYRGGFVQGGVGRDSDGSVVAAFVYGPTTLFAPPRTKGVQVVYGASQAHQIIGALVPLYDTAAPDDSPGPAQPR